MRVRHNSRGSVHASIGKGFMVARVHRTSDDVETNVRAALVHLFKLAQIPFGPKDGKAIARGTALKA
jgi:hypothetical protein